MVSAIDKNTVIYSPIHQIVTCRASLTLTAVVWEAVEGAGLAGLIPKCAPLQETEWRKCKSGKQCL